MGLTKDGAGGRKTKEEDTDKDSGKAEEEEHRGNQKE